MHGDDGGHAWASLSAAGRAWLAAFVVVMLAVPGVGLVAATRPAPFSWHMFAGAAQVVVYEVERDGRRSPVDVGDWLVRDRGEHRARAGLAAHLCGADDTVDVVWVERRDVLARTSEREPWPCED